MSRKPLVRTLGSRLRLRPPALPLLRSGRARRVLLWAASATLFLALTLALGGLAVVGAPVATVTRVALNVGAVGLGLLLYPLLAPYFERGPSDPIRALWTVLLFALGLLGAFFLQPVVFGAARLDPATGLPADLGAAMDAALVALLEALFAVALLHTLRPLVLFRRTIRAVRMWGAFVVLATLAALASAAAPPDVPNAWPAVVLTVLAVGAMIYVSFRLAWIVPLPFRRKLAALGLAFVLVVVLAFVLVQRSAGTGAAAAMGDSLPLSALFSRSLSELVSFALAFGVLYGSTTFLSLLFHLPTSGTYEQRSGEIRAFRALAELTGSVLDRRQLLAMIASAPVTAGIAEAAWLALVDVRSGSLAPRIVAAEGIAAEAAGRLTDAEALTAEVATTREPLLLGTAAADHRVRARPGDGIGSLLVLPLTAGGQAHGALFAARAVTDGFEEEDAGALATFAGQAALALSHAALFEDALEKERMARELALAREVQQRLLPQHLPEIPGAEIAVAERPAHEVCGDYYDVVELGGGCVGVLVADVAGKGAAAAFYMAELKGIFQSTARLTRSPGAFLAQANEALAGSLGRHAFISAVYGVLDPAAGTFTFARAGHCPVVMARAPERGGGHWLLRADGLGLGLDAGPLFRRTLHEQVVHLAPGDVFALYSDGLVEARNGAGEEYGYDRLTEALCRHRGRDADGLLAALLAEHRAFTGDTPHDDDLTLVVLRWNGRDAPANGVADGDDARAAVAAAAEPPFTVRPAFLSAELGMRSSE
ncbi:MAG TPA: GAF domain-containing SpoIIE family protein phosphatase [Rubricoccaceae bacterium]|nr:GAF domain-containing SpoIIE family protein phosphatase [Rubricoccaceae bacterium]